MSAPRLLVNWLHCVDWFSEQGCFFGDVIDLSVAETQSLIGAVGLEM